MAWQDVLKEEMVLSHLTPINDIIKDLDDIASKITGLMGAVGKIRDNTQNYVNNEELLRNETHAIKQELQDTRKLIADIKEDTTYDNKQIWARMQQQYGDE